MFSAGQKREISAKIQAILRATGHPELPEGEITFTLVVLGAEFWSFAQIQNNGAVTDPSINPHNEAMDTRKTVPVRCVVCNDTGMVDGNQCRMCPKEGG
jgi:hypothetical protein